MYIEAIFVFATFALAALTMPETYAPVLLRHKAQHMRTVKGDDRYWHPHESQKISPRNIVIKHLSRPLRCVYHLLVFPLLA